jgi:hypothetical protein
MPRDFAHDKRGRFFEPPWKYPYVVKGSVAGRVYYHKAFKTKKAAQSAAKGLRSLRDHGTQRAKPNTVAVIKRRR